MLEKKILDESRAPSHEDVPLDDLTTPEPGHSSGGEKLSSSSSTTSHHSAIFLKPSLLELGPRPRLKSSPHNNSFEDLIEEDLPRTPAFQPFRDEEEGWPIIPGLPMSPYDGDSAFEEVQPLAQQQGGRRRLKQQRFSAQSLESDEEDGPIVIPFQPGSIPCQPSYSSSGRRRPRARKASEISPEGQGLQGRFPGYSEPRLPELYLKGEPALFNLEVSPVEEDPGPGDGAGGPEYFEMFPLGGPSSPARDPEPSPVQLNPESENPPADDLSTDGDEDGTNETLILLPPPSLQSISPNEKGSFKDRLDSFFSQDGGAEKETQPGFPELLLSSSAAQLDPCPSEIKDGEQDGDGTGGLGRDVESCIEYDTEWVAPDGGWGWWVLFGSIVVNILIPGTVKSFGVLFIEFIEDFQASPSAAAWIPALSYWLYSSTGPFASALAAKYSYRIVTIIGGLLASAGLCLSCFATSITYLYVSYGVIGGLGAGLAYPIGVFMVSRYFDKRRGLANGLCTSGSALGSVLVPPLLRILLKNYGYRKAILYMGIILLNVCLAALFYDPVEKHLKKKLVPRNVTTPRDANGKALVAVCLPKSPVTDCIDIGNNNLSTGASREIAASMPIAIPVPQFEHRDVRDRRGSGSIRRATFQIGHETPQGDSWSLRSIDGASPLAARLLKEDTVGLDSSPRVSSGLRPRQFPRSLESNPDMDTLFTGSHLITGNGVISTLPSATASRSRLNLTAIPEDDDYTPSESGSRGMDWNFYRDLPSAKQRLLRLSLANGNQILNQSGASQGASAPSAGLARTLSVASNVSNSSFHYVSTIHHGSLLMAMQYDKTVPDFASTLTLKSVGESCWKCCLRSPKRCCKAWPCAKKDGPDRGPKIGPRRRPECKKIFDLSLLRNGFFIIMLLSNCMTAVGYTNFIILLPSYAIKSGFDKSQASILLSVVAALDFVGRIGGAALSDLRWVQRKWFFIVGLLMSGVALSFLPLAVDYGSLVIYCACFGLASGTYIGVTAVILADKLGPEKLGSSYGITLFINGLLQLAGPPICGVLYENLGRYEPILVGLGISLIFGASLWVFEPFIERRRERLVLLEAAGAEFGEPPGVLQLQIGEEDDGDGEEVEGKGSKAETGMV